MRTFLMLYSSDFKVGDDGNHCSYKRGKSRSSESRAFTLLSSVSLFWYQTLVGWPESRTRHWVKHQLKKMIECECTYPLAHQTCMYTAATKNDRTRTRSFLIHSFISAFVKGLLENSTPSTEIKVLIIFHELKDFFTV